MSSATIQTQNNNNKNKKCVMRLENLSKKYGKYLAVDRINLEVYEGETIGLVGPNGAGKTTTIKMIAKLLRPTTGRILIRNNEGILQDLHKNSRNLVKRGFLIDVPYFYSEMTANQLLRYFANSQNYPKEKINDRINYLLKLFKLSDWKHEKVKNFSKGMRQKLGIIQALLVDPQIIILDEPQTGLDPKARIEIRQILRDIQKQGKTIFVASHMLHEISEVCDKVALINQGKIIAFDTIENLEKNLKTKDINCTLLEPLDSGKKEQILARLNEKLSPYLDVNAKNDKDISAIIYKPEKKILKFYYDGLDTSKAKILETLITDFKSDFKIISFTQPKTSQLERIYSQIIVDDETKLKNNRKRRKKNGENK
ncbi:MAG: ABC transporter ATP-binding protein [Promethearchaeota archaeon]